MTRPLAIVILLALVATPSAAPDHEGLQGQRGAPPPASVDGPPDRGKGTLGDAGNGTSRRQTDNGNAAANPVFDGPIDPPRLRSSWNGQDKAGPSHSGAVRGAPLSALTYTGVVNYAEPSHGRWYLAIPNGPGWRVRICGPAGCLDRTSTDAGPSLAMQRAGKIADLNSVDWQQISGVSLRYGGFQGTVLVLGRAKLPETDTR